MSTQLVGSRTTMWPKLWVV